MDLVWNFTTSAGVVTQTAITPTTAGDYDWTNVGDGMYKIEIPASGGASINNDTEGSGFFTGICTGVLAWRSPIYTFRAAGLNDALIDNAYSATRGLTGTALPDAVSDAAGGLLVSIAGSLDMDAKVGALTYTVANKLDVNALRLDSQVITAAAAITAHSDIGVNSTAQAAIEDQYDGTGLSGGNYPATQDQVSNIGSAAGGAINIQASADNTGGALKGITLVGAVTSGTYSDTEADDGSYHNITGTATAIDLVYKFEIGGNRQAVNFKFSGYLNSANDTIDFQVYDDAGSTWVTRYTLSGQGGTTNVSVSKTLVSKYTGSGSELGNIYIRLVCNAKTNPDIFVDELLIEAVSVTQSVGYADGAIWFNSNSSNTGSEDYYDGTAERPCSLWSDVLLLSASLEITRFRIINGSTVTLPSNSDNYTLIGDNWSLALNGQSIAGAHFHGAISISGVSSGTNWRIIDSHIKSNTSLASGWARGCRLADKITLVGIGGFFFQSCFSSTEAPVTFDYQTGVGAQTLCLTPLTGGVVIDYMEAGDVLHIEGDGQIILNSTCTGGIFKRAGDWNLTDNSSGVTITNADNTQGIINTLADTSVMQPKIDKIPLSDGVVTWNSTALASVKTQADDALSDVNLDHLVGTQSGIPAIPSGTFIDQMMDDGTATFDRTTDSLQAIRDRGDTAWITGGGGGITDILNIQALIPKSIDLANTANYRVGMMLINSLDDLPSTAEITSGTISIDRKAIGATSWTSILSNAACSESAGLIYYDEGFDSGSGYAEGDSIRITLKSQKITVSANDYEITDATGRIFYTEIRQTMRGTDSANTVVPDAAGVAPTAIEIRQEIDSNSTQLSAIAADVNTIKVGTIQKNTAGSTLVQMLDSSNNPVVSVAVIGQRRLDNGSFGAMGATISNTDSNGWCHVAYTAGDVNGTKTVGFLFSATGAVDSALTLQLT